VNAEVHIHAFETTPVQARPAAGDVDLRIGDVRIWLPREVAQRLAAVVTEALAATPDEDGAP
jgi:hypothetical protein